MTSLFWLLPLLLPASVWALYRERAARRAQHGLARRLEDAELALHHIGEGVPCGILYLDAEQRVVRANRRAAALT